MAFVYVASSKGLAEWSSDVGLGKNLFKVGVAEGAADEAIAALNEASYGGTSDWKLVRRQAAPDGADEAAMLERLGRQEKAVDPAYYPRLRGTTGIFRVKPDKVQNHIMVKKALAGDAEIVVKINPKVIAEYLLETALGQQS